MPGVYATLLAEECERASAPDARLFLTTEPDEFEKLEEQGRLEAAVLFTELLEAGADHRGALADWWPSDSSAGRCADVQR